MAKTKHPQVTLQIRQSEQTGKWALYVIKQGKKPQLRATFDTKEEAKASVKKNATSLRRNGFSVKVQRGKNLR